jgi:hypothetical protein
LVGVKLLGGLASTSGDATGDSQCAKYGNPQPFNRQAVPLLLFLLSCFLSALLLPTNHVKVMPY